jgi:hypothetical protein
MRAVSRFPVLRTRTLRPVETVTLRGSFSFDALSPDGSTLYVIEHVNRRDVAEYQVRAYDIERGRLLPYPIRDHRSDQVEMYGYPVSRAASPDGRWAYTLYQGSHHSFVHALDTVARTAVCVDLPVDTPPEQVSDAHLVVGPGGETLAIDSRTGGTIGVIDTKTLSLETAPAEEPTVPAAQVRTPAPAGEREADRRSLPWALLAGAIALAAGAFGARRLRRRRSSALDELGLVLASLERAPGDELDGRLDDEHRAQALADRAGETFRPSGVTRELDGHGERRLLLHAGRGGPYADVAADRWGESGDDLADRAREDVHPADDQHVVGAADAADPRAGAATRTRARLHDNVVAGAEELPARAVLERARVAGRRVDQLRVDEPAGAEVHAVALLALAPERDADVADPHRLGHAGAPALLERVAERRLAAARLARDEHALDARLGEPRGALDEVRRVRGGEHRRLGTQPLDRREQPLGVARPDRDVREPDPVERRKRGARDERARVVRRDDPLVGANAGGRI